MASGFVQINRNLFDHPVWTESTPEQKVILLTIIEKANYKPATWEWGGRVITVERGQFITSLEKLAIACGRGVTTSKIRTALKRFEKYGILTIKSTNQSRLITVEKYDFITCCSDEVDKRIDRQLTSESQANDKQIATTNKNKESNKEKERERTAAESASLRGFTLGIINYFNEVAGTHFDGQDETYVELMAEHLKREHTEKQLKRIIDRKVKEWSDPNNTNDMTIHINPATVLNIQKYDQYLNSPSGGIDDSTEKEGNLKSKITELNNRLTELFNLDPENAHRSDEYMLMDRQRESYQKQLEKIQGASRSQISA